MQTDIFGKQRYKINLHMHTTLSDGQLPRESALERYRAAGYDVVAVTDHWVYEHVGEYKGMTVLSGAEYNIGGGDCRSGVYHIVAYNTVSGVAQSRRLDSSLIIDMLAAKGRVYPLLPPTTPIITPTTIAFPTSWQRRKAIRLRIFFSRCVRGASTRHKDLKFTLSPKATASVYGHHP